MNMYRICVLICLLICRSATASEAPDIARQFWFVAGFQLNFTTLPRIQKILGSAQPFRDPQGHYDVNVCYFLQDGKRVILFTTGELGGDKQYLLGYSIELAANHKGRCSKPNSVLTITLPLGLYIGMPEAQFRKLVGGKLRSSNGGFIVRDFAFSRRLSAREIKLLVQGEDLQTQQYVRKRGFVYSTQIIWGKALEGRIIAIGTWKEETL